MQRLKKVIGRMVAAAVLLVAGASVWGSYALDRPLPLPSEGAAYTIVSGSALATIARDLDTLGWLPHPRLFVLYTRLRDLAGNMRAGEYWLEPGSTTRTLLELFVSGEVVLHEFTIIEGWTVPQLMQAIAGNDVLAHTLDSTSDLAELAEELELDFEHPEGRFFPDTYHFPRGTSDAELLQLAAAAMQRRLATAWQGRSVGLPFETPYEALVLASIVERETALDAERPEVAGVFVRRLQRGMRLQTDPTVIYGLGGNFDGNLTRADLDTDSPYNTYTRNGLPPTPISLPGQASLSAAVNPAPGDALYFVATGAGDGSHEFTSTLDEHNAAVRRYLDRLREQRALRTGP